MGDYRKLQHNEDLLQLHREIKQHLYDQVSNWDGYDYGEGYCNQGLDLVGISGLRDTRARVEAMGLKNLLRYRTVVDIGCNTGFVALSIADEAAKIPGCEVYPHLVAVANSVASYLQVHNVEFITNSFEEFAASNPVDAVLSFANHSTYDGKTTQSLEEYFQKCWATLKPNGMLLFESHHPDFEGGAFEGVCSVIGIKFKILERKVLQYGTPLSRGRTYIIAQRRPEPGAGTASG